MKRDDWERNEEERRVCKALEKVAAEIGAKSITAVAIAYIMQKAPYVFPLIGGRKVENLKDNIEVLTRQQIEYIESVKSFDVGFPVTMVGNGSEISVWMGSVAVIDKQPPAPPLRPVAEARLVGKN
ncbi:hypothetical protein D9611_007213 [Ephemerocybe angulata]|uniref:NADP-dependent oxidoreductase domain-containing protein n=1 Tax=Ephemerocybe angulata TaxID=980116 RepID=A0A8H5EW96_9AGAR|nr:hypothetical protein D9611_007213 [Tulosesus angulatus]